MIAIIACSKDEPANQSLFEGFKKPAHFPDPSYNLSGNPVTKEAFELGRKLFYEPRLSRNNTISCGSCHIQSSAFTQHGHDVSHGIDDRLGRRNSPPIMNLAWIPAFMWDGGVFDLDLQPIVPITAHEEMDESVANVISKLQNHAEYPQMFKTAFGNGQITTANFMKALSQFMIMCVSAESKYDSVILKLGNAAFTAREEAGYKLVQQKCGSCHKEPLFTDNSFRNNGIGIGANNDMGHYDVTLNAADRYQFKVPSLRNLAYTAPYMHDGRFIRLDAVLDQYSNNIQQTPNLDPLLKSNLDLTAEEKQQLLAFLNTLNDKNFINNRLLSEQ
ncbi:cytochrome c peroxidase [Niabella yanshanensis]|uniref:Cytochrome c peroxidase n=1 Tax=Niabella yanshanensis TaxID=577386 RepID=A0ABZ0W4T2_9BACT|nr:cytochrome c peroxidase [Niabella yanshanensis]WQD38196.1 cytochrome c peroxidase [Niabella yanshanensis]